MDRDYFSSICEALFFASSEPLTTAMVRQAFGDDLPDNFDALFQLFLQNINRSNRGIQIVEIAGGYQCVTRSEFASYIRRLNIQRRKTRLSRAALETLAIIAYRQPVTCPEIEQIRGVDSGSVIKNLIEKGLVTFLGRRKTPGTPMLYGTTRKFLIEFGLKSLEDLPSMQEFEKLFEDESLERDLPFDEKELKYQASHSKLLAFNTGKRDENNEEMNHEKTSD